MPQATGKADLPAMWWRPCLQPLDLPWHLLGSSLRLPRTFQVSVLIFRVVPDLVDQARHRLLQLLQKEVIPVLSQGLCNALVEPDLILPACVEACPYPLAFALQVAKQALEIVELVRGGDEHHSAALLRHERSGKRFSRVFQSGLGCSVVSLRATELTVQREA